MATTKTPAPTKFHKVARYDDGTRFPLIKTSRGWTYHPDGSSETAIVFVTRAVRLRGGEVISESNPAYQAMMNERLRPSAPVDPREYF